MIQEELKHELEMMRIEHQHKMEMMQLDKMYINDYD